ncbi:site-specific integrase [Chromobacterium violaceum]|uniref:Site-specific tyrosine recombinase XerC n=1 Tax=Chromobacterium violaceum TaxID=536 RepID=A0AAX2M718_CHRVL|nr:site-specific integrase [Chromobacterium violaceum]OLZ79840.1 integrase [Chromobacterium violaceum]STB64251.1 site-specific tyrosine recombinase XerC [Chromobacterium violaceum]SUX31973.1 site-specific tyrosine recombinase XerC [Chromobacterium violaceum]
MASITVRGPHQYQAQVRRKGYPTQTRTFESKTEAKAWAAVMESEMARGVFIDRSEAERTTLGDALQRYAQEVTPLKKSAGNELSLIRRWQKHPLALRSLASLYGVDFAAYRDARLKVVSDNTVRLELALISHVFTIAQKEWNIPVSNPIESIRKPKVPEGRDRRLIDDEEERLLKAVADCQSENDGLRIATVLAIETGMRAGEIVDLTWRQIDFNQHIIMLSHTKNGTARVVPLTHAAEDMLKALPRPIKSSLRLFAFHDSRGMSKAFRRACKRADIIDLHFHDLRHEAASRKAPRMQPTTLAKVMGWKTIQMAMRYYNPSAQELVAAVRAAA